MVYEISSEKEPSAVLKLHKGWTESDPAVPLILFTVLESEGIESESRRAGIRAIVSARLRAKKTSQTADCGMAHISRCPEQPDCKPERTRFSRNS